MSALNPDEGLYSDSITATAAGVPLAPGAITEVPLSRTGTSIGLQWVAPTNNGGSAILAYTLVMVHLNQPDVVQYYGT